MSKKPGPKPSANPEFTETVAVKMSPEQKAALVNAVLRRKADDKSLPLRWGISDYVRELIVAHLAELDVKS